MFERCISLHAASQVLKKHEDEFFAVMDAKLNLLWLKRKNVISDSLVKEIESADYETAKELLFEHLDRNANVAALREYCRMAIAARAYPKMQSLGEKMLRDLPPKGLLRRGGALLVCVCVCVCVCACVCVCVYMHVQQHTQCS